MRGLNVSFGAMVIALRNSKQCTRAELAELAGISRNYMGQLETDVDRSFTVDVLLRVAKALGADACSFVTAYINWKNGEGPSFSCGTTSIRVLIPENSSCTGYAHWTEKAIDTCIADIVAALIQAGIYTSGCCCGHGKEPGNILLTDGRIIEISFPTDHSQLGRSYKPGFRIYAIEPEAIEYD